MAELISLARCVLLSEQSRVTGIKAYRAAHRRVFSLTQEGEEPNRIYVCRDVWVLGPWRTSKRLAEADKIDFATAFSTGRENGLHQQLRQKFSEWPLWHGECSLHCWEIEVESNSRGERFARGFLRGDDLGSGRRFTIQGQWQVSRTKADLHLKELLVAFGQGGTAAAALLATQLPRASSNNLPRQLPQPELLAPLQPDTASIS